MLALPNVHGVTDWDRMAADRRIAKRDRMLARYLREVVHPFSVTEARRLDDAGLRGGRLKRADDLDAVRPVDPAEVDGIAAVLRPTAAGVASSPDRFRWWWATLTGRRATFVDEEVEPRFRPIHFDDHGALVVASSAADLDRLADLGRRALGLAGVRRADAVVSVLPARGDLSFWHLTLGCRRGGVAALHLGESVPAADVASYAPTVLAGSTATLRRVATEAAADPAVGDGLAGVRLVLVAERLDGEDRVELAERFPGAAIRAMWCPAGVRAPWVECTAGNLHTWPDAEVVQVLDQRDRGGRGAGSIVWSPLGWHGTVVLRLRTGLRGRLVDEPCGCGARSPRLVLVDAAADAADAADADADDVRSGNGELEAALAAILDAEPLVASWFAEVRDGDGRGRPEVLVHLAPERGQRAALEADLARLGRALAVNRVVAVDRVVVERPSLVNERIERSDGVRVSPR